MDEGGGDGGGGGGPGDEPPRDGPPTGDGGIDWDAFEREFAEYAGRQRLPEPAAD